MVSVINKVQGFLIHVLGGKTTEDMERITDHLKERINLLEKAVQVAYQNGTNQMVIRFDYFIKNIEGKRIKNKYQEIVQWVNKMYLSL